MAAMKFPAGSTVSFWICHGNDKEYTNVSFGTMILLGPHMGNKKPSLNEKPILHKCRGCLDNVRRGR